MKKYFAIIVGVMMIATIAGYEEAEVVEIEWVESCHGVICLDRAEPQPPRKDWGWQNNYCGMLNQITSSTKTNCNI